VGLPIGSVDGCVLDGIAAVQHHIVAGQLKELYDKKTELENLEIVNTVRAMVMDKDQIMVLPCRDEGQQGGKAYHYPAGGDGQ